MLVVLLLLALPLLGQDEVVVLKLPGMDKVKVKKDVAYGNHKLDLYRPANAKGTLPVVIFVNGIDRAELKEWGQYTSWPQLAAVRGMAAITHTGDLHTLLKAIRENAAEWKLDATRIAIWACSANGRVGTATLAKNDFRAAVLYYALMDTAPKNTATPVLVARAGLDAPNLNQSLERWVAQAVTLEVPLTFVNYPEGRHGFELLDDTPESRQIVEQTLDFLQHHLATAPTPRKEPMTLAQLQALGTDAAISRLQELRKTHPTAYVLQEATLNSLGYSLLAENKPAEAVKWLELVTAWYPDSANAHDSLGDAYEAAGRSADAIRESERALQLLDKAPPPRREGIRRSAEEKLKRLRR
jgi:dienelactone hydrolase